MGYAGDKTDLMKERCFSVLYEICEFRSLPAPLSPFVADGAERSLRGPGVTR